jgi:glycosyltransferase involved in cell wall biosynthesis
MLRDRVFHVGLRYSHHARHSGYEAFGRYVGTSLRPPVRFRWTTGPLWTLNQAFARATRHPWYSIGAHLTEWGALQHMARHRGRLYHILYGDTDLWLLRRAHHFTGNRLIASFHETNAQFEQLGPALGRVVRHLDGVILVAEVQREYFARLVPPERIFVQPHGVDTQFFHPLEEPPIEPIVVTVGAHLRDFETLKKTLCHIWAEDERVRLLAIGTRSDKKWLFSGLDDPRITFMDRVSDEALLAAHQAACVAVFALQDATANNSILEAMASGLPIVATDVGGVREYVDATSGVLCPPRDPESLAAAVLRLLGDSSVRVRMARASRARAETLDYARVAVQMRQLYERLLVH